MNRPSPAVHRCAGCHRWYQLFDGDTHTCKSCSHDLIGEKHCISPNLSLSSEVTHYLSRQRYCRTCNREIFDYLALTDEQEAELAKTLSEYFAKADRNR